MPHKDPEVRRQYYAAYNLMHKSEQKAWRDAHPKYHIEHYQRHREPYLKAMRLYQAAHPDLIREINSRRRARKANAPINDLTKDQWREIQVAQDHRCYYCAKRRKGKLTQDHITPLFAGGSHTLHNVIASCGPCNCRKHTGPPPIPVQPLLLTIAPAKKSTKKAS